MKKTRHVGWLLIVAAVVDGNVPDRSADQDQPRWTSLPFKNRVLPQVGFCMGIHEIQLGFND